MATAYRMDSPRWAPVPVLAAALAALLAAGAPVAAQEAQGPPDGYIPPAPTRSATPPAQGPDNGGIAPLATPQPRAQTPPPVTIPSEPAPQRSAPPPLTIRPRAALPAQTRVAPPVAAPPAGPPAAAPAVAPLPPPSLPAPTPIAEITAEPAAQELPAPAPVAPGLGGAAGWLPGWWPWALAGLAALLAGLWWLRRDTSAAARVNGGVDGEADWAPPPPSPAPLPRPPKPTESPLPAPVMPSAPPPAPQPVSGRAKLAITLKVDAIDVLNDAARISFSLLLANQGDRTATGGLVRIALQQANRRQADLLERFFDGAGGSVLAEDVEIAAGDVGTIQRHALLAFDQVEPMLVAGYPSLIPVIGFDVTYHWDGEGEAFGQVASAFVLGSTAAADGRIAPVRLDLPPRRLAAPAARVTEMLRVL